MESLSTGGKIREYFLELYNRTLIVAVGVSKEELDSHLTARLGIPVDLDIKDADGATDFIIGRDISAVVVYMHSAALTPYNLGVVAHEATHAAVFMCKRCGVTLDPENDEPLAYLVGWVAKKTMETINEYYSE